MERYPRVFRTEVLQQQLEASQAFPLRACARLASLIARLEFGDSGSVKPSIILAQIQGLLTLGMQMAAWEGRTLTSLHQPLSNTARPSMQGIEEEHQVRDEKNSRNS
ncbi:Synaptophysin-Like Protein 1 [Manis pentadactyla]|nr:Synaptophysin-Like Protein 1 [Manis pentadactyla]